MRMLFQRLESAVKEHPRAVFQSVNRRALHKCPSLTNSAASEGLQEVLIACVIFSVRGLPYLERPLIFFIHVSKRTAQSYQTAILVKSDIILSDANWVNENR